MPLFNFTDKLKKNIPELKSELIGYEQEIQEIKKQALEKNFENSPEKLEKIEIGAMIIMNDLFGGMPTKIAAYIIGSLKEIFPDKDNRWLIETARELQN
jgi:hypothetical protein